MDVNDAAKRGNYGEERYEKIDFQKKVQEAYYKIKESNWKVLNAKLPVNELQQSIQNIADEILKDVEFKPIQTIN